MLNTTAYGQIQGGPLLANGRLVRYLVRVLQDATGMMCLGPAVSVRSF